LNRPLFSDHPLSGLHNFPRSLFDNRNHLLLWDHAGFPDFLQHCLKLWNHLFDNLSLQVFIPAQLRFHDDHGHRSWLYNWQLYSSTRAITHVGKKPILAATLLGGRSSFFIDVVPVALSVLPRIISVTDISATLARYTGSSAPVRGRNSRVTVYLCG